MQRELFIGLMSGTSLDGVDAVLARFPAAGGIELLAHSHAPLDAALRGELLALNAPGENELHRAALASNALARGYASAAASVLAQAKVEAGAVRAIGAHGQTVRHRPREFDATGYTLQLLNAALLAELTGIDIVCDLRSRDVAAGGQGAPLVPAFHRAIFARLGTTIAVLNLGGIANLTVLHAEGATTGFDCGPANALMDHWCERQLGRAFDDAGGWAASGTVDATLLDAMRGDPYFVLAPPKSTGRDHFNARWLERALAAAPGGREARDVQATLAELTARVCAADVLRHATCASELLVCGGGAFNQFLMRRLSALLPGVAVARTDARGLPVTQVEAAAFAWLAWAHCERQAASIPTVTGAVGARVLGALYPA
ncbi:MAG TPA: anhydro-N-acetylmuramic acid kinase [Burkholderiaceae bacterium]|nr:anhydro-N-acetylmuramic acid kinase [Burkholderiaceae bacterium]